MRALDLDLDLDLVYITLKLGEGGKHERHKSGIGGSGRKLGRCDYC